MSNFFLFVLLAAAGMTVPDASPKAVVMRFLSLTQQGKWDLAATMLTPDAEFGVNDVGGPLDVETLPTLGNVYRASCSLRDALETDERMLEQPNTRFVETRWVCPKRDNPATREMKITFFVQGDKLAGYYIS